MQKISDVKTRKRDIFVVSYPRSGNYWLRFMLATYLHDIHIDWNNFKKYCPMIYHINPIQAHRIRDPRIFGAHDTYTKVPNSIFLYRDPRDVVISQYFYNLKRGHTNCSFDDFFDKFVTGAIGAFGTWRENITSWVDRADYVLSYNDLQDNASQQLRDIVSYLEYKVDNNRINHSVYWCRFENMKRMEHQQGFLKTESKKDIDFVRKGKSRQWEEFLSSEQKQLMEDTFGELCSRIRGKRHE